MQGAHLIWEKINKNGPVNPYTETPCWLWTGSRNSKEAEAAAIAARKKYHTHNDLDRAV